MSLSLTHKLRPFYALCRVASKYNYQSPYIQKESECSWGFCWLFLCLLINFHLSLSFFLPPLRRCNVRSLAIIIKKHKRSFSCCGKKKKSRCWRLLSNSRWVHIYVRANCKAKISQCRSLACWEFFFFSTILLFMFDVRCYLPSRTIVPCWTWCDKHWQLKVKNNVNFSFFSLSRSLLGHSFISLRAYPVDWFYVKTSFY